MHFDFKKFSREICAQHGGYPTTKRDVVDQEKGFVGGEFKIGIIPTIMPTLLPMFLKNFTNKYPKVQLKIEELTTDDIITKINDGRLDAAIAATPLEQDKIKERVLYYEPFVAYVPENHRLFKEKTLKSEDLNLDDLLLLEDGHCFKIVLLIYVNLHRDYKKIDFSCKAEALRH